MLVPGPWSDPKEVISALRESGIDAIVSDSGIGAGQVAIEIVQDEHLHHGFACGGSQGSWLSRPSFVRALTPSLCRGKEVQAASSNRAAGGRSDRRVSRCCAVRASRVGANSSAWRLPVEANNFAGSLATPSRRQQRLGALPWLLGRIEVPERLQVGSVDGSIGTREDERITGI